MAYKSKQNAGIECRFRNDKGEETTCFIPKIKVLELIEDTAYETVQKPTCHESTCAANGFCECNPVYEDMDLKDFVVCGD